VEDLLRALKRLGACREQRELEAISRMTEPDRWRAAARRRKDARKARNWIRYMLCYDRPYRWGVLSRIAPALTDAEFWPLVADVWMDSESIGRHRRLIRRLLASPRPQRDLIMTAQERAVFSALPDPIVAWRGTRRINGDHMMSWTLDEARAVWFAERFAFRAPGLVLKAEIPKDAVVAYLDGRSEREVIVVDRHRIAVKGTTITRRRSSITGEIEPANSQI
jgi:hypothetical protein